jgi:AraC-like DNA-binding protein
MRERVKAFVRQRLRDSSLSIDDIAQTFNCTKRYLHKVFSEDERSLNQYIWELRLDRCSQDLASAELLDCSITRIAYLWGFRSPTHFSRVFRQRFGVSPSAYRSRNAGVSTADVVRTRLANARLVGTKGLHPLAGGAGPVAHAVRTTS